MIKYNYIVRTVYSNSDCEEIRYVHKARTLADAYNFITNYYLKEELIKSQADFYQKYPFKKVEKSIEEKGYFVFLGPIDIQTVEFYINDYVNEVY